MGLFFNRAQAGKDYCIFCGNTIVQGMVKNGKLYVADILFDSTLTEERDAAKSLP